MTALDDLVSLLDLEQLEVNLFRGYSLDRDRVRLYGGEVLAQALMAAGRTVDPARRVHSMHAYFLKLGDPKIPVVYDVDRIRDGASFTTRRVVAVQHGQAIFNLAASFHVPEQGPEHYDRMPEVPLPDALPQLGHLPEDEPETIDRQGAPHVVDALDFRHVGGQWAPPGMHRGKPAREPDGDTWFRTRGRLPDDPLLHSCVVAYASDLTLLGSAMLPHPLAADDPGHMIASLDHVMWFHRPFRADDWLLYHVHSPSAGMARGFATGQIFCADGTLAVSVAQEGLLRPMRGAMTARDGVVDLRSDTVTTPTPEMRRAMADAEVGDDAYGEDPTVRRLESLAAGLLGKEAALYVPSGTMANQLALRLLARPGTEVLCGERAHVYRYEHSAAATNSGAQLRPLPDADGTLSPSDVARAAASQHHHLPAISAVFVENTHMPASGRPWRVAELDAVTAVARDAGFAVHCDGARIWNAAIALDTAPRELTDGTDTTMFCLSKGLSAPVGSLLCGTHALIAEAREQRARLGGGMRQAGVIAAAGIVALETMVERLADDHARARVLADVLAELFPESVDPARVETNIVCARAAALPADVLDALGAEGVLAGTIDVDTVRFVTHRDVDDAGLARAVDALHRIARRN